ncbi:hypothetical protein [Deinococcus sp. AJ005]|nr:hypothetical protein [Deinococcus sp. AJ005]
MTPELNSPELASQDPKKHAELLADSCLYAAPGERLIERTVELLLA